MRGGPTPIGTRRPPRRLERRGERTGGVPFVHDLAPGRIARFVSGERDIRLGTLDRIATALDLRLVEVGRAKTRGAKTAIPSA